MRSNGINGQNTLQSLFWRTQISKAAKEVPETHTYQCHIQNHIWGFHVQYIGTLAPSQYLIASYDTGIRPRILQRWIKTTIYNDESSKYRNSVVEHSKILHNLGYRCRNLRSLSTVTSTIPTMWIDVLKSNLERTQQIVNQ